MSNQVPNLFLCAHGKAIKSQRGLRGYVVVRREMLQRTAESIPWYQD